MPNEHQSGSYLFFDDIHEFVEPLSKQTFGGGYYECKRCGFRVSGHHLNLLRFNLDPHFSIHIRPCRNERYQYCSCGKIMGDGTDGTCIYSNKTSICARCGQQFTGHHSCERDLLAKEFVKKLDSHSKKGLKGLLNRYFK